MTEKSLCSCTTCTCCSEEAVLPGEKPVPWFASREVLTVFISGLLILCGWVLSLTGLSPAGVKILYLAAVGTSAYIIYLKAWQAILRKSLDMNVLVNLAVVGAILIDHWLEGAVVIFLFSLGNALEKFTLKKNRRSISSLIELAPKEGRVLRNRQEVYVPVKDICIGETVLIKPGERIAIDGLVVQGFSTVNQSSITGEFDSVEKSKRDEVYAGTLNEQGYLEVMVTRKSEDSTLAKIIYLVEEAQAKKAVSQQIMERFARYYTPAVITMAFAVILIPPLFFHQEFIPWFYRGLTLMVVSCPCALVISTPVSLISAIGNAARKGILIKGGCHLEGAGAASVVALDKTGTLTEGKPELLEVLPFEGGYPPEILVKAASLESMSEHPLGQAIVKEAQKRKLKLQQPLDFEALTARGIKGVLAGETYYIGSPTLFKNMNVNLPNNKEKIVEQLEEKGQTVLLLGTTKMIEGALTLRDKIRPEAFTMVKQLKRMGVRTVMLTGDNDKNARIIAEQLNLDEYHAGLLPQDKVEIIKELTSMYGKTIMVGDGINDAPALAASSIGIAMGAAGNDTALEAADIALMSDNLAVIPKVMHLSKATMGIIKQNIAFSLLIKLAAVMLVFPGWLSLWLAILADDGALIVVTMNGLRLMGYKNK